MPKQFPKNIKLNAIDPEPLEVIAESIIQVADAFDKIKNGKLTQHAIVILISETTGVTRTDIRKILNCAADLRKHFIK